jgi:hypothetical protein
LGVLIRAYDSPLDAAGRDRTALGMQLAQRDEWLRLIVFSETARRDAIAEWQRLLPSNQMAA